MPTYDYRCDDCKTRSSFFMSYAEYGKKTIKCPNCGGAKLKRVIGRIRVAKSEDARMESLADPSSFAGLDENDPRSMAKMMRKMGAEMGEDLGPEFGEAIDRLEAGESPEDIEKAVPGLGGDGGMGDDMGGDEF